MLDLLPGLRPLLWMLCYAWSKPEHGFACFTYCQEFRLSVVLISAFLLHWTSFPPHSCINMTIFVMNRLSIWLPSRFALMLLFVRLGNGDNWLESFAFFVFVCFIDALKLQVALMRPTLGSKVSPTCRTFSSGEGGLSRGGADNSLFSKGAFSLCLSDSLLHCCNGPGLDSAAPGGAVTNKGLPGGDLNVEAFRG